MDSEICVSVVCTAYNHKKYIRAALESFVMQQTNFKYEVLIHDDASTDGTTDIIREYEKKHPNLIRVVYQKENQYSKGILIPETFLYPLARGRYIAICEGDDYWIDPHKLQKQFDMLEKHPDVDICTHSAICIYKGRVYDLISSATKNCVIPIQRVITGRGGFVATNSIMIRTQRLLEPLKSQEKLSLDYVVQIIGSYPNGMLFLTDVASVYNYCTEGSWTRRHSTDLAFWLRIRLKMIDFLNAFNSESNYRYDSEIRETIRGIIYERFFKLENYRGLMNFVKNENIPISLRTRVALSLRCFSLPLFNFVKKVYQILAFPILCPLHMVRTIYFRYKYRKCYSILKKFKRYLQ